MQIPTLQYTLLLTHSNALYTEMRLYGVRYTDSTKTNKLSFSLSDQLSTQDYNYK